MSWTFICYINLTELGPRFPVGTDRLVCVHPEEKHDRLSLILKHGHVRDGMGLTVGQECPH